MKRRQNLYQTMRQRLRGRSLGIALIFWSAVAFYAARSAELSGITHYNRGAPVTPNQLYAVSFGILLIGIYLACVCSPGAKTDQSGQSRHDGSSQETHDDTR
jgi:hypothetical protein